jgi:hypothetical protein
MPIAPNTCVKNYPAVYRNPETLCEGCHDLARNIRLFEAANRAGTSLQELSSNFGDGMKDQAAAWA